MEGIVKRSAKHLANVLRVPDSEADALIVELIAEIEGLHKEIAILKLNQCACPPDA